MISGKAGRSLRLGLTLLVTLAAGSAGANDGGISYGGSPRLLTGHPSVSMQSELVRMTVGASSATVDCRFVFRNDGPACQVRMGFPDQARGADDPEEDSEGGPAPKTKPRSSFTSFRSYVDGQLVPTELIHGAHGGNWWHAKTVSFPAHGTRLVRDVYTVPLGGQILDGGAMQQTSYILHTGASWHGPIGRSEVVVTFAPKAMTVPLVVRPAPKPGDIRMASFRTGSGTILYSGPGRPMVAGKTLRFVRTNWRPTEKDDIGLYFNARRMSASP